MKKISLINLGEAPEKDKDEWHLRNQRGDNRYLILRASFDELVELVNKEVKDGNRNKEN